MSLHADVPAAQAINNAPRPTGRMLSQPIIHQLLAGSALGTMVDSSVTSALESARVVSL